MGNTYSRRQPNPSRISPAIGMPISFGVTDAPSMNSTNKPLSTRPTQTLALAFIGAAPWFRSKDEALWPAPTSKHRNLGFMG